ncbi:MAG: M14 family zinc carboxypeptidase, partial [Pseudomonadota bacterium]|nr:M14 family zinc carboxypeptidase [Pseudomonadota bacterium]
MKIKFTLLRRSLPMLLTLVFSSMPVSSTLGQEKFVYWPDAQYDPAIPTVEAVLGYAPGERITWHRDVIRYFEALAVAAPDRIMITEYARSWENRELILAVVSAPGNIANLDAIKSNMQRLADPRITEGDVAAQIIESQAAVTWLSYGVHGNEISSTDAAMLTAYHLLASQDDARVADIMANTVVVIDPMQNPDGRDRFIHNFEIAEGLVPDSDRLAAEHDEPWPGGRTNHYLFDMNRDWFIQTQPETQGRTAAMLQWYPVAYVDAHEMGSDGTYFFAPEAIPYNPHLAEDQRASLQLFGRNNARYFDMFGFDYFTREVYDAFYPGYGA